MIIVISFVALLLCSVGTIVITSAILSKRLISSFMLIYTVVNLSIKLVTSAIIAIVIHVSTD